MMPAAQRGRKRLLNDAEEHASPKRTKVSHRSYGSKPGVVLTCGQGDTGQLGLGEDVFERGYPGLVKLPDTVTQVCCGGMHTVCLTSKGEVYTFGCNDEGALGRDTSEDGSEMSPGKVALPARIVQVSAGDSHTAALTEHGSVLAWGNFRDQNGSIGLTVEGKHLTPVELLKGEVVVKIASGCDHIVCLTYKGEVYTSGCAEQGQLGRIAETFTSRGARKGLGYLLNPAKVHPVARRRKEPVLFTDIWTGTYVTFALSKSKDVYAWGLNNYYQLGCGDMINRFHPQKVESLSNLSKDWQFIVGGQHHTLALDGTGRVYSVGRGNYGRLGHGDTEEVMEPKVIQALQGKKIVQVAAGGSASFAVSKEGVGYAWGQGDCKQLASGEEDDIETPARMKGKQLEGKEVLQVSAGGQHTCILARNAPNSH